MDHEEERKRSMFNDRRRGLDRRKQRLPMPTGLDRRNKLCRRNRHFQSQPWWLRIRYAEELVSERELADELVSLTRPADKPSSSNKNENNNK